MKTDAQGFQVLVAGAGVAGLATAIAFAMAGWSVRVFEKAPRLDEVGAGIQLSPNATRILDRLGVLDLLMPAAVRPDAVVLREAGRLRELARIPLGRAAEERWGAPYLTIHRADLQSALLARIAREPEIRLTTGAYVRDAAFHPRGVTLSVDHQGRIVEAEGRLLVGADGVWSTMRGAGIDAMHSSFTGLTAWRSTIRRGEKGAAEEFLPGNVVSAFLDRRFHLVAYPLRGGEAINLVAITSGGSPEHSWSVETDAGPLAKAMAKTAPAIAGLAERAAPWTAWPLHAVDPKGPWTGEAGIALVGDAAHAMTPFAAQGAAMAIEDAAVLAHMVAAMPDDLPLALRSYETERRPRVLKVARRGALNRLAWHASGPVALVRNLVLARRSPERLAADLDWLYGWDFPADADRPATSI